MSEPKPKIPRNRKADSASSRSKKTPVKKILNQLALGMSQSQVAKSVNVSKQAVSQMLQRYGIESNFLESFKENRADIFAGLQETVLASLTTEDVKDASIRDRTILFGTLYDKERLERGQSTSNVSMFFRVISEAPDLPGEGPSQDIVVEAQTTHNRATDDVVLLSDSE